MSGKTTEPLGPAGKAVVDNISRLRRERRISMEMLSELTNKAGRRIPVIGIRRIERGQRSVPIDDLCVLAEVFGVPPEALYDVKAAEGYRLDCLRWLLA